MHLLHGGQCFPLHWYEKAGEQAAQAGLSFDEPKGKTEVNGYVKHDGITDEALANFRQHYKNKAITKEAIFYYVYGQLHDPHYRIDYAADLKKMLPHIPTPETRDRFEMVARVGRLLADLHMNYEKVEPYPGFEARRTVPPWPSAIASTIGRPRPEPFSREWSTRAKRSKMRS